MKLIRPTVTACGDLLSTNVPQDYPLWVSGTSYSKGAKVVISPCGAMVYESMVSSNLANPGTATIDIWLPIGVSNRFAMFDTSNSTVTSNPESIVVEVSVTKLVNAVSLINVQASEARLEIIEDRIVIYDMLIPLRDYGSIDWYDFYFGEITTYDNYVNFDLPTITNATGRLTLSAPGGVASIGSVGYGVGFVIGESLYGVSLGIKDYSLKTVDDFGNVFVTKRGYRNTMDVSIKVDNVSINKVLKVLAEYRATPAVWVADAERGYTILFGFYGDFKVIIPTPAHAECSLNLEALI